MLVAALLFPLALAARRPARHAASSGEDRRLVEEKTGALTTRDGLRLRLVTDLGNVHIRTGNSGQVSYRVRIETDSGERDARNLLGQFVVMARNTPEGVLVTGHVPWRKFSARLWASFDVNVPRNYQLDVLTQAGNIETEDLNGRASLTTAGGNIATGRLGGPSRLETQGGHITVGDVAGDLTATTAGGHITVGNVQGNAVLQSAGGHIRVAGVGGAASLETAGGNISLQRAGAKVVATTAGGQIDLGETSGSIRAKTGGGGIRVVRLAGPTELETGGGSIYLTQVLGTVRASTPAGNITAWFAPEGKLQGASQLECGSGDIVVYLPRELPVTIDATVELGGDHGIDTDPAFPLKLSYVDSGAGARAVRAEGALNGGGEVLRLKAMAGNIRLRLSDAAQQLQRHLELQQRMLERQLEHQKRQLEQQQEERQRQQERQGRFEELQRRLEERWSGRISVDSEVQKQKLVSRVEPAYPEQARRQGIAGTVRLKAIIGKNGTVEDLKVISGHSLLVQAALDAVRQWRYAPTQVNGKPVAVVTTVDVEFRSN